MKPIVALLRTKLFRSTVVYTIAGTLNGAVIFFLMPVLTRVLDREEYGLVAMFRVLGSFAVPLVAFYSSVSRQYYDREGMNFPEYVLNAVLIVVANSLLVALGLALFGGHLAELCDFPVEWMWCIVVFACGKSLIQNPLTMWRVQTRPLPYGAFQISQTVLQFGLTVLLVVALGWGWQGGVVAETMAMALYGLLSFPLLRNNGWLKGKFNPAYVREIMAFNVPIVFHLLCRSVITMSDRIFITNFGNLAEAGLYAAGYQIGMIIFLLTTSFNTAWVPFLYEKLKQGEPSSLRNIVRFTYLYFAGLLALALLLGAIAPWFAALFLGEAFVDAAQYVIWIALGFAFNGMYLMQVSYIVYSRKTRYIAVITGLSATLNIALNYVLIQTQGPLGAAQATTITFLVTFVVTWLISARLHPMPWSLRRQA